MKINKIYVFILEFFSIKYLLYFTNINNLVNFN